MEPSAALVLEDSPTGALAALRAGCQVLGVAAAGRPRLSGVLSTASDLRHVRSLFLAALP